MMGTSAAGLRYRLRSVPVCRNCFCVYARVHDVVASIRDRKKDHWADKVQSRKRENEEREKEHKASDLFEFAVAKRQAEGDGTAEPLSWQTGRGTSEYASRWRSRSTCGFQRTAPS